jgi:hypothetical protein
MLGGEGMRNMATVQGDLPEELLRMKNLTKGGKQNGKCKF